MTRDEAIKALQFTARRLQYMDVHESLHEVDKVLHEVDKVIAYLKLSDVPTSPPALTGKTVRIAVVITRSLDVGLCSFTNPDDVLDCLAFARMNSMYKLGNDNTVTHEAVVTATIPEKAIPVVEGSVVDA